MNHLSFFFKLVNSEFVPHVEQISSGPTYSDGMHGVAEP